MFFKSTFSKVVKIFFATGKTFQSVVISKNIWNEFINLLMPMYPLFIFGALLYYLSISPLHAGVIRRAIITTEKPTIVRVAKGRTTALQFWTKPEKLVLGSPNRVQVDFLGKDVTVSPLAPNPGNLLIYTKGGRYVVLFQLTTETLYDDVVKLSPEQEGQSTLRLDRDIYHAVTVRAIFGAKKPYSESSFSAIIKDNGKSLETDQWPEFIPKEGLKCESCVLHSKTDQTFLICTRSLPLVKCRSKRGVTLTLHWSAL